MIFNYTAIDRDGLEIKGAIDAVNVDVAINSLQRKGLVISSIKSNDEATGFSRSFVIFERVSNKEVVILSRQMATLFGAQVSALRIFRLLGSEAENSLLRKSLVAISDDLQAGSPISKALSMHPKVFSPFYVNMVKSGEESGKLDETFAYLADYLDRNYAVTSKAKNALIYPAFVIFTFISVMVLMLTMVIPRISGILKEAGQDIPIYTKIVIGISNALVYYGIYVLIAIVIGGFFIAKYLRTSTGKNLAATIRLQIPYIGALYRKLYLSRIADNMNTMLRSGIAMIKVIELTAAVVDNKVYENILNQSLELVKTGTSLSDSFAKHPEYIPGIMVQMIKIGEETGELGSILETLAKFYQREVINAVDTLVDLIEPAMIVLLGAGVAFLLASVLIPIYNISNAI
jgi:type IV pilus assembly protein PilC